MKSFSTSVIVQDHGQIKVENLPFSAGTVVDVSVQLHDQGMEPDTAISERSAILLAALDKGQNEKPIGKLNREELYDR